MLRLRRLVQRRVIASRDNMEMVVGALVMNFDTREVTGGGTAIDGTGELFDAGAPHRVGVC